MKTKIVSVLLVFLLSISITGCTISGTGVPTPPSATSFDSDSGTDSNETPDASAPATPSSTSLDSDAESTGTPVPSDTSVLEAYKEVLQGKAEFFSTNNKKALYLNDFLTNQEIYGTTFEVTNFAVVDMDGDEVPEVVLGLSVGNEPQFYEVLHGMNDTVYGYLVTNRGLQGLKADGTFGYSNGAADSGFGTMKFDSDTFSMDISAYSESSQGDAELTVSYFINNESVTKEAFDSFANEQSGKEDVVWHEFSEENIETELL